MNNDELLEYPPISPEISAFIGKYCPRDQYSGQWERLRPQIIDLVRKAAPATTAKATELLSTLGFLLTMAASSHTEGSLEELITNEGIERCVLQLNSRNISRKQIQGARAILTDLHRVLLDLPTVISDEWPIRKASKPVTLDEITELLEYLKEPTLAVHLHLTRRLILALGAGLIGDKADKARIFFGDRGISSIVDGKGRTRPLSKQWIALLGTLVTPDLELYKVPKPETTSGWLRGKSLSYLWSRLRDEWLLEQLDGSEPAFVQFRRACVTNYDVNRLVLRGHQIPAADTNYLLRNSQKYISAECARATNEHRLHQDLS